jgi:hypothetical protein
MERRTYRFECGTGIYCFVFGVESYDAAFKIAERKLIGERYHNETERNFKLKWFRRFCTEENTVIISDEEARIVFSPIE